MDNGYPKHIGFIMDGNGRWATKRGLTRTLGHRAGVNALKRVVTACAELGVPAVTVFAFSTENWNRPKEEVDALFGLIEEFNESAFKLCDKLNIRLKYMGDLSVLDKKWVAAASDAERKTANNSGTVLNVAVNYGARADIVRAAKAAAKDGNLTEEGVLKNLSTGDLPPLDLVIRTGGEKRLSNFLLYEAAYAELIFSDVLWPDMNKNKLQKMLSEYAARNRRFGGL